MEMDFAFVFLFVVVYHNFDTFENIVCFVVQAVPFGKLWLQDLGAPVFGSLSVDCNNGNGICSSNLSSNFVLMHHDLLEFLPKTLH